MRRDARRGADAMVDDGRCDARCGRRDGRRDGRYDGRSDGRHDGKRDGSRDDRRDGSEAVMAVTADSGRQLTRHQTSSRHDVLYSTGVSICPHPDPKGSFPILHWDVLPLDVVDHNLANVVYVDEVRVPKKEEIAMLKSRLHTTGEDDDDG